MWAILLTTLSFLSPDVLADGRYHTKAECESFVEFVAAQNPQLPAWKDGDGYVLVDSDGLVFKAQCVPADGFKEKL